MPKQTGSPHQQVQAGSFEMQRSRLIAAVLTLSVISGAGYPSGHAQGISAAPTSGTEGIDPVLLGGLSWRSIGPARGGRSQAVAGSSSRPLEYYFGATGGGLWKTTDGGVTWRPVTDGQIHSSSVGAVAIAPSNPDIVYIGTGEADIRGNIIQGDGAYKSVDAGKTW